MVKIYTYIIGKFRRLGPGFITGAADDDPSGVATYSIAGAQFGYKLNWLSLFLLPMMISIQEMCGRIGMCSGTGLAGVIKRYYSKKLLLVTLLLLTIANIINIGADLGFMAASLQMIIQLPFVLWLLIITLTVILLEVFVSYRKYSIYLKWMGLTLCAYIATAFIVKQNWADVIRFTVIPHVDFTLPYLMTLVGFIGTTISPYLFFWQASEEVEEEIEKGEITEFNKKAHISTRDIAYLKRDTVSGMVFSNLISSFIVITTAATLFNHGINNIETPAQVASALKPLAGQFAFLLFTFGIIGIGLQAVPILAGGLAYAFSETFGKSEGLSKKYNQAKFFYSVLGISIMVGAAMNIIGINPVRALYYTAILNGIISIPLIAIIIRLADDTRIVGKFRSSMAGRVIAWITLLFISISAGLLILQPVIGI